jgi:hypothetical protein
LFLQKKKTTTTKPFSPKQVGVGKVRVEILQKRKSHESWFTGLGMI